MVQGGQQALSRTCWQEVFIAVNQDYLALESLVSEPKQQKLGREFATFEGKTHTKSVKI